MNAAIARRSPGSTLKPFIYAAAVEAGFTPDTVVSAEPFVDPMTGWSPTNYDGSSGGGEVSGVAYRCDRKPGTEPASAASPVSLVSPGAAPPAPHSDVTPVDRVFLKARKCQEKGGVWVNDQCVIPIE